MTLMWAAIRGYRAEPKFPAVPTDDELRAITVPVLPEPGEASCRTDHVHGFALSCEVGAESAHPRMHHGGTDPNPFFERLRWCPNNGPSTIRSEFARKSPDMIALG
jgi:hypothetical protein